MIITLLTALAIGGVSELGAFVFRFWRYRHPALPVINVVISFGVIQGLGVGWAIGRGQDLSAIAPVLFMIGALIGVVYEGLNTFALRLWSWPDGNLLGVVRPLDKAALIGVSWGLVPLATAVLSRLLASFVGEMS